MTMLLSRAVPGAVALFLVAVAATAGAQFSLDFGEPVTFRGFGATDDDDDSIFDDEDDDAFGFRTTDRALRLGGGGTRISYSVSTDDYETPEAFEAALQERAEAARLLADLETECEVQAEILRAQASVSDGEARAELRDLQDRCADARADLREVLGEPARRTRATTTTTSGFGGGSLFDDGFGSGFGSFRPIAW